MLRNEHPDFHFRGLIVHLKEEAPKLGPDDIAEEIERVRRRLTDRYGDMSRKELKKVDALRPYIDYFKKYKKTYHLFLQIESFLHKERGLPFVTPLVSAYFLSEMETGVLASAHDLEKIDGEAALVEASGGETLRLLNGEVRNAPAGDALLVDRSGVLTCVTQGQDVRSTLSPGSRRAAYYVYGPPGVGDDELTAAIAKLQEHLLSWYGNSIDFEELTPGH